MYSYFLRMICVGKGYCSEGMFKLGINTKVNVFVYVVVSFDLWHNSLAHLNYKSIEYMHKYNYIDLSSNDFNKKCEICILSKITKKS